MNSYVGMANLLIWFWAPHSLKQMLRFLGQMSIFPHPYGCKAMGFKSSRIPSVLVEETSGISCQAYSRKIS
ncbi:MAG: hypothetical protein DRG71_08065 [Deltaproteobacteria bacterium]|nr:MAG: hypothetical protein DRG71_08065 [Deltaproteobacteria bacterium]